MKYFKTFRNLLCTSTNTTWRSSSFLFTSFTCWTWLKQCLNFASQYILKFGVSLSSISTHLEILRGILDNWFRNPLALSFQNTPCIHNLKPKFLINSFSEINFLVNLAVCYTLNSTLLSLKLIFFWIFFSSNQWSMERFGKIMQMAFLINCLNCLFIFQNELKLHSKTKKKNNTFEAKFVGCFSQVQHLKLVNKNLKDLIMSFIDTHNKL